MVLRDTQKLQIKVYLSLAGNPRRPPKKKEASKLSLKIPLGVGVGRQSREWGEGNQGNCEQR